MQPHVSCPRCGTENAADAVFCRIDGCRKALTDQPFINEVVQERSHWWERLGDRVTGFVGRPHFIAVHLIWFAAWIFANLGGSAFDAYPFDGLGVILGIEAILITGLLLVGTSRQSARATVLGELDYELSVRASRRLERIERLLTHVAHQLDRQAGVAEAPTTLLPPHGGPGR